MTTTPSGTLGTRALVIIPTFDHGPLLEHSIGSALAQDWEDLEVVVICDGAPESTRHLLDDMCRHDPRLSSRWCAKGPRLGETHRNEVLATATADFVCYLSDDDLWAPGHLRAMHAALERADVAHANHLYLDGSEQPHVVAVDLSHPTTRRSHLDGASYVCLSSIGHTMHAASDLGLRWRVTPDGRYTDWYFLTGAFELDLRFGVTDAVTAVNIASMFRRGWSLERRYEEHGRWRAVVAGPDWAAVVSDALLRGIRDARRTFVEQVEWAAHLEATLRSVDAVAAERGERLAAAWQREVDLRQEMHAVWSDLDSAARFQEWQASIIDDLRTRLATVESEPPTT